MHSKSDLKSFPQPQKDMTFDIPEEFQHMILHDSRWSSDWLMIMGNKELLDGLGRAKLWLAGGGFEIFFQFNVIHF